MRLEFPELGEGFFVEIKNPKLLKWKEQKSIAVAYKDDSMSSQFDVAERVAVALIKTGYVLNDEGKQVTFPLDLETVGDLPSTIIEEVAKKFGELKQAQTPKN